MGSIYPESVLGRQKYNRGLTLKFASPVAVNIIESLEDMYKNAVWGAIAVGLSYVLMGAVLICIIIYGSKNKDDHAMLCGLGYHFFVTQGILTLSYINGWSTPMHTKHRRLAHAVLQICGFFCAAVGIVHVTKREGLSTTIHGLSGAILAILTILTVVVGPFVLKNVNNAHIFHISFGVPTFLMSAVCISFGLLTPEFQNWAGSNVVPILLSFIVFYSALIAITTFMKYMKRS